MSRQIFHSSRAPLCALAFLAATAIPAFAQGPAPGFARIHYYRPDGNYTGWGLYAWNATTRGAPARSPKPARTASECTSTFR